MTDSSSWMSFLSCVRVYQYEWFDISILMPNELIYESVGLCLAPSDDGCAAEHSPVQEAEIGSMSRTICEIYLLVADQARIELGLPIDTHIRNHALAACIHDYQTTNSTGVRNQYANCLLSSRFVIVRCQHSQCDYQRRDLQASAQRWSVSVANSQQC